MQASHDAIRTLEDLINSRRGDTGRLRYILHTLMKGKKLYSSDERYLEKILSKPIEKHTHHVFNREYLSSPITVHDERHVSSSQIIKPLEIELAEIRKNVEHIAARIEKLEIRIDNMFEQISDSQYDDDTHDQNKELHDPAPDERTKNKTLDEFSEVKKPIIANRFKTVQRLLTVITIITIGITLGTFATVGVFEEKVRWQDYGISYDQAVYALFLLVIVLTFEFAAWLAYGIVSFLENRKKIIE